MMYKSDFALWLGTGVDLAFVNTRAQLSHLGLRILIRNHRRGWVGEHEYGRGNVVERRHE